MDNDPRFEYHKYLEHVASIDLDEVQKKDVSYGASWKKRGGAGAFMMLARKWDRLEEMVSKEGFDIFKSITQDYSGNDGSVLAEVRDLRRYLLLVEAEMLHRKPLNPDA